MYVIYTNLLSGLKLNNISIRNKIWGGFGIIILLVLAVVDMTAAISLTKIESSVDHVVNRIQPMMLASNDLTSTLNATSGALGYFMLTKDQSFWKNYEEGIQKVNTVIKELTSLVDENDTATRDLVSNIKADITTFVSFKSQMLELSSDAFKNEPGLLYSAQKLNPVAQEILQKMSEAWISEEDTELSPLRKEMLILIGELRYTWA